MMVVNVQFPKGFMEAQKVGRPIQAAHPVEPKRLLPARGERE